MDAAQRTGNVPFAAGHIPTTGAAVTAGFYFDVTVRFALITSRPLSPVLSRKFRCWKSGCGVAVRLQRMTAASPARAVPEMPHLSQ